MDGSRFDHLSRLITQPANRRAALGVMAALGIGAPQTAGGKGRRNGCKGGCGPCQNCRKKGKRKKCVTAPDGATCAGGTCQGGTCCLTDCTTLGPICGPRANGCGGTVACTCGAGGTPACDDGRCATCATTCGASCSRCWARVDGTTKCGAAGSGYSCSLPCTSDVDCPAFSPYCGTGYTTRDTNVSQRFATLCPSGAPSVCMDIIPC